MTGADLAAIISAVTGLVITIGRLWMAYKDRQAKAPAPGAPWPGPPLPERPGTKEGAADPVEVKTAEKKGP